LEQGSHGSYKVIGNDLYVEECWHSRIIFRRKFGIPWIGMKNERLGLALSTNTYIGNILYVQANK
jgi:hypothetical protein